MGLFGRKASGDIVCVASDKELNRNVVSSSSSSPIAKAENLLDATCPTSLGLFMVVL